MLGDLSLLLIYFFIYSFAGWLYECLFSSIGSRHLVNRGFLNGPYCPIYGFGALFFIYLTTLSTNPLFLFISGGALACVLEYVTSSILEKLFHARWWDYSDRFLNLNGRICLAGFIVFGLFAALMPHLHALINSLVTPIPTPLMLALAPLLLVLLLVDLFFTTRSIKHFNDALAIYQKAINQHAADALNFIQRGRRSFVLYLNNQRKAVEKILTFQQRRLLSAFPELKSHSYDDALDDVKKLNRSTRVAQKNKKAPRKAPKSDKKPSKA